MKHLVSRLTMAAGALLIMGATSQSQAGDGITPASDDMCANYGFSGKTQGLCNAFCEAMDCDSNDPQASDVACTRVLSKIESSLPEGRVFDRCDDADGDGFANSVDNCYTVANPDQTPDPLFPEFGLLCGPDNDGILSEVDNCPEIDNPGQEDTYGDPTLGDACEDPPAGECRVFSVEEAADVFVNTYSLTSVTRYNDQATQFGTAIEDSGAYGSGSTPDHLRNRKSVHVKAWADGRYSAAYRFFTYDGSINIGSSAFLSIDDYNACLQIIIDNVP